MIRAYTEQTRAVSSTMTSVSASYKIPTLPRISVWSSKIHLCEPTTHRAKITFRIPISVKSSMVRRNLKDNFSANNSMVEWSRLAWTLAVRRPPLETTCTRKNLANSSKRVQRRQRRKMLGYLASIYQSTRQEEITNSCIISYFRRMRANCSSMTNC